MLIPEPIEIPKRLNVENCIRLRENRELLHLISAS